jgi:hypothetical protein
MKRKLSIKNPASKRKSESVLPAQVAFQFLIAAINETRAEDQLVRILQSVSIKSIL